MNKSIMSTSEVMKNIERTICGIALAVQLEICVGIERICEFLDEEIEKNTKAEAITAGNDHPYNKIGQCFWRHLCSNIYPTSQELRAIEAGTSASSTSASSSGDSVVSDNVLEDYGRISLAYENLRSVPKRISDKYAACTRFLDLSHNKFRNISFLTEFNNLHTLVLDHNHKIDISTVPHLPNLKILWINNCDIYHMVKWIRCIRKQFPVLEQLSVMGNPGLKDTLQYCRIDLDENLMPIEPICPGLRNCGEGISDYREYILQMLPDLKYLDGCTRETTLIDIQLEKEDNFSSNSSSTTTNHSQNSSNSNSITSNNTNDQKKSSKMSFKRFFRTKILKKKAD